MGTEGLQSGYLFNLYKEGRGISDGNINLTSLGKSYICRDLGVGDGGDLFHKLESFCIYDRLE